MSEQPTYQDYQANGFIPLFCKGYQKKYNSQRIYKVAKEPVLSGWTKPDYISPTLQEIEEWERDGGWTGWVIPKGCMAIDVEDPESITYLRELYRERSVSPRIHLTNNGEHHFFKSPDGVTLPAQSTVFVRCGLKLTYRVGGKNYLILAPCNGRSWEVWE